MITLYTPRQVAESLQVSESTVLRMFYAGNLPGIILRSGKRKKIVRFNPTHIEKWLQKRAENSTPIRGQ